jgi:hypothetical protein
MKMRLKPNTYAAWTAAIASAFFHGSGGQRQRIAHLSAM